MVEATSALAMVGSHSLRPWRPRLFIAIICSAVFAALWLPSLAVLIFRGKRPYARAARKIWPLWLAQPVMAAALIYLADAVGLANPAGYMLAICTALGGGGALVFWYAMRRG